MSGTEPLRDRVARALYEEGGVRSDWSELPSNRREPWRKDADRIIPIVSADHAAVVAERDRAQQACERICRAFDRGHPPALEDYDAARNALERG